MHLFTALALLGASLSLTSAHMQLRQPLPLQSKFDPLNSNPDYSMTAPLHGDGSNFPCKGYLTAPGRHVTAQYVAGKQYSIAIEGTATHEGGSCQLSLSYDNGTTFRAIHSILGGCPLAGTYPFTMPADVPGGNGVIFSWTWFNKVGNREMYQNCALVDIQGTGTLQALAQLPPMFVANIGKGCGTVEGTEVVFPQPGRQVAYGGSYAQGGALQPGAGTSGTCGALGQVPPAPSDSSNQGTTSLPFSAATTIVNAPPAATKNVPAPTPATGLCKNGEIQCLTATTWSQCSNGVYIKMGSVAPGTVCLKGQMVLATPDNVAAAGANTVANQATTVKTTTATTVLATPARPQRPAPVVTTPAVNCRDKRSLRPACVALTTRCAAGQVQLCEDGRWTAQHGLTCVSDTTETETLTRRAGERCLGTGIVCASDSLSFSLCDGEQAMQVPAGTRCLMTEQSGGIIIAYDGHDGL